MRILAIADVESKYLWDYYEKSKLEDIDLIVSAGDLEAAYLEFLATMAKCPVVYVPGNHDKDYSRDHILQSVQSYKELKTPYGRFILFHYPILEWNAAHYGSVHLHGHIHSTGEYNAQNLSKKYIDRFPDGHTSQQENLGLRIYDVGVDANDYKPISLEKIVKLMRLPLVKKG